MVADLAAWGRSGIDLFGIDVPIVLGPMSGGPSTPALVAGVSSAGGLGMLGGGYRDPGGLRDDIRAVRDATNRPFGVNLFAPESPEVDRAAVARAVAALAPYRAEVGLGEQTIPDRFSEDFDSQLEVVATERVPVFTVTFGPIPPAWLERLHAQGATVGATVTTVAEGRALEETGVDFLVAQGAEAGGHRGSFLPVAGDDLIGLTALVPQVCDAVAIPVVGAGGIADGRGVIAALALGACAVQLGTAFLQCPEAGTNAPYRHALRSARPEDTVITSAFSGRRARGLANRMSSELAGRDDLPPYPILNALTRELRQAAAQRGDPRFLSLWAGQAASLARPEPAAQVVARVVEEAGRVLATGGL
jgi:nitronate monooxygenase